MCPVLAFTPEVEGALRWFDATHELTSADGQLWWRRIGLPGPGSVGDQNARLMEALDLLQQVHLELVRPERRAERDSDV